MRKTFAIIALATIFSFAAGAQSSQDQYPLANISQNPGLCSIFHSWGFIGDSLCSGEHEYHTAEGKKAYVDLYEYSWGMRMCALMGVKGDVYAKGGETAKGWIDHFWDKAKEDPKQAYIMALCINDAGRGFKPGDVKTDVDTSDFTKNAETFAGYYAGIIQRIQSIQPDAKIFVVTRPRQGAVREDFNNVIRSMATTFKNVYVIDLYKYAPYYDEEFKEMYFLGGHMNAAGYEYTAWMMMNYIDWIIRHNPQDFKEAAFIGTPYKA